MTVDGTSHALPEAFTVFATQNPIEFEGTYPLPEAELDRFLVKVLVGYPEERVEQGILERVLGGFEADLPPSYGIERVADGAGLARLRDAVRRVRVEPSLVAYITAIVRATRAAPVLTLGASPRGSVALLKMAQAAALLDGRPYVVPDDVKELAPGGASAPDRGGAGARARGHHRRRGAPRRSSRRSRRRGDRGPVAPVAGGRGRAGARGAAGAGRGPRRRGLLPALDLAWLAAFLARCGPRAGAAHARGRARGAGRVRRGPRGRRALPLAAPRPRRAHARGPRAAARSARRRRAHRLARSRCRRARGSTSRLELTPVRRGPGTGGALAIRALGPLGLAWRQETVALPWSATVYPERARRRAPGAAAAGRSAGARPAFARSAGRAKAGCSRGSASGCRATRPGSSTGRRPPGAASRSRGSTRTSGASRC